MLGGVGPLWNASEGLKENILPSDVNLLAKGTASVQRAVSLILQKTTAKTYEDNLLALQSQLYQSAQQA